MEEKRRKLVEKTFNKKEKCEHKNVYEPSWYYKWCRDCNKVILNQERLDKEYFLI